MGIQQKESDGLKKKCEKLQKERDEFEKECEKLRKKVQNFELEKHNELLKHNLFLTPQQKSSLIWHMNHYGEYKIRYPNRIDPFPRKDKIHEAYTCIETYLKSPEPTKSLLLENLKPYYIPEIFKKNELNQQEQEIIRGYRGIKDDLFY